MNLIDTHAHIYLPEFDSDRSDLIGAALQAGVTTILMPAIDSSTHEKMLEIENEYSSCLSMMGLHPCSVKEGWEEEIIEVDRYLQSQKMYAIGEIGLDFYWDTSFTTEQYAAFRKQIEIAIKFQLPIVIHSRNAVEECIKVVEEFPGIKGVFHCFSGNEEQAKKIIDLGFYLGIGGVATFKNGGLDKLLPQIGLEQLVLETDAPYLAPVPYRGKRNEPSYIKIIAEKVASILNKDLEEVAKITTENAKKLFSLP